MRDAIIVGIDSYATNPLLGCVSDANDIAECLAFEQYNFDCKTILNAQATRSTVLESLAELAYSEKPRDMLIFYFAGHGQVLGNAGHLVMVDGKDFDPGISLAHLSQMMESAGARYNHVIVILDCCHSGAAYTWTNSRPMQPQDIDREISSVNESRCVLAACRPEEEALEVGNSPHGIFTSSLVKGLLGDAVNYDGEVTLLTLFEYISKTIPTETQTPVFKGDVAGTVVVGKGFDPRMGPPIEEGQLLKTLAKAAALIDEYENLQQREFFSDRSHRLNSGYLTCAADLERCTRWFAEIKQALPDVVREQRWVHLNDRLTTFRRNIARVEPGQNTQVGRVIRSLGQGGYGHVWEVGEGEKRQALKIFHGDHLEDTVRVQRFKNGYLGMKDLNHPRVVQVRELTNAPYAFTMDYIEGENLRNCYLDRDSADTLIHLLVDIAETVQHAHSRGVRHRDIKPENIIVKLGPKLEPIPYLTDFDLAYHETNRTITTNIGVGGVLNYAAPEQLYEPNAAAARAETVDVYAMGQLMYFVVTGSDPSPHDSDRNIRSLTRVANTWVDNRAASSLVELYKLATQRKVGDRLDSMSKFSGYLLRSETFAAAASGTDKVEEDQFCARVAHRYAGVGNYFSSARQSRCNTLSGQFELTIRLVSVESRSNIDVAELEFEFSTVNKLPVPDYKTGTSGRETLNKKVDKALRRFTNVKRRAGTKGTYQVFVEVSKVALSVEGVAMVCEILTASISALEQW